MVGETDEGVYDRSKAVGSAEGPVGPTDGALVGFGTAPRISYLPEHSSL